MFKETNIEEDDQDQNDDYALIRFEFIEMLVRIAQFLYIENGNEYSIASAFQTLVQNHILPMRNNFIKWQEFRDDELWCPEVNDLLDINHSSIRLVYNFMAKSQLVETKCLNRIEKLNRAYPSIDQVRYVLSGAHGL